MAIDQTLAVPAPRLARRLLGCELSIGTVRARITETEAYQGENDRACHASKGRTSRSEVLYHAPGTVYVYLCYGIHHLLNIVCDAEEVPAAVLIRSVAVLDGEAEVRRRRSQPTVASERLANGPGKVCQALAIDGRHNGLQLGQADCPLQLHWRPRRRRCRSGPRVGIAFAGEPWVSRRWRFWEDGFPVARG